MGNGLLGWVTLRNRLRVGEMSTKCKLLRKIAMPLDFDLVSIKDRNDRHCPRCIGGRLFLEPSGGKVFGQRELVCINCAHRRLI